MIALNYSSAASIHSEFQRFSIANQIVCLDGDANGGCGDAGDVPFSYDAYGNLTSDRMKTFTYDAENRLISVTEGVSTTMYTYNGDGDRMSQTVDGVTTTYVNDTTIPLTMVLAETTGAETTYYLHGLDLVTQNDGVRPEYFAYDGLGSARQVLDELGNVLFAQTFDPYCNPYANTGTESTNRGFTGKQTDGNGLIFLRARYYDAREGRFLQRDPWRGISAKPASYNPWLYSYGNPINLIDPSGKAAQCDRYQRADLTQWLVDEMNENRKGNVFLVLWTAVQTPELIDTLVPGPLEVKLPPELTTYGISLGLFADVVKPHGLWDFKNAIFDLIGRNIQLTSRWYRFDVPGNMYFGFIGLAIGFDKTILHCGADYATNGIPCSGSDPLEDYEAIEAGYDIYKQAGWGQVDEHMVRVALMKHPLVAAGEKTEPNAKSLLLPWPYPVGTFDDGISGWIIKHR